MDGCAEEVELPDEVLFLIFSFLNPSTMQSACQVNHHWHQVAKDNFIWKSLCEQQQLSMNSANQRTFNNDWRAWYQALQEGSFDILEVDFDASYKDW